MTIKTAMELYREHEPYRAMCEAIQISRELHGEKREKYFLGVQRRRGLEAAMKLRQNVYDLEHAK